MARAEDVAILIVDVQEFFLDGWMAGESEPLLTRLAFLCGLASAYDLPCLATFEEPVATKGRFPARLAQVFPAHAHTFTKNTFDCCGEPAIRDAIAALPQSRIAVAGGETDVCVLQSVLGLLALGKRVVLLEDVLFSEEPHVGPAIRRMEAAGAVPSTVKTLAYELRRSVAEPSLAARLRERAFPIELPKPEDLPEWRPGWEGAATQRAERSVAGPLEWASQA
ncbi:MAG TPA: isochorismatase family protein [Thermomicrobiales bacterium]|nr:isochorismatase family protein [Thermomicrobiales bacterium]